MSPAGAGSLVATSLKGLALRRRGTTDVRTSPAGAVIHVHGKGNKDRTVPVEADLLSVNRRLPQSRRSRLAGDA